MGDTTGGQPTQAHQNVIYTPPGRPQSFVAYTATPRPVGDEDSGETVTLRASVFVREYPSIRLASFSPKTSTDPNTGEEWRIANVTFDAASAGVERLTRDFGGSVVHGTAVYELLEKAAENGLPVSMALECVRRAKTKSSGHRIDLTTSIHELRGAARDGRHGQANTTAENTKVVVVGAAPADRPDMWAFSPETASDPAEWETLRANKDGSMPPAGWRVLKGGIVPSGTRAATGSGEPVDVEDVAARVAAKLKPVLEHGTEARPRPQQQTAHATEAKEWEPWNSDGRLNRGSRLMSKERASFAEAFDLVTATNSSAEVAERIQQAWRVSEVLLWIADQVQVGVYGEGARPHRMAKSHLEAARWAAWAIEHLHPLTSEHLEASTDALREWATTVVSTTTVAFADAAGNVERWLNPTSATASTHTPDAATTPPTQASTTSTGQQATPASATGITAEQHQRYEALLHTLGLAQFPDRIQPLLTERFGTWQLGSINQEAFEQALAEWEADPAGFSETARLAYTTPTGQQGAA